MRVKMRILSLVICLVMLLSLMPTTVFAVTEIHQANITITKPVGGENPDIFPVSSDQDKYYADGGTGTMTDVSGVFADYKLPDCAFTAPTGKYFSGWFVGGYMKDPGNFITVLGNTTVIACWKNIPTQGYTVTFDGGNECSGSMDSENKSDFYGELILPECGFNPPTGKRFVCWRVGNDEYNPGDKIIVNFNTTVDAIWETIPQQPTTYTVAFDANGGTGNMASVNNVSGNYTLPPNGFTPPANKQFKCWAVGEFGDEYDPGDKITVNANTNVKAVWEEITSSKQVISDVVATSSDLDIIVSLYGLLKIPNFTVTEGAPAYINASTSNLRWQKKIDGIWTNQDNGRFTPGEWRISSSLRIDGTNAYHYELGNPTTLTVNGQAWTVENNGKPSVHPNYSHANIVSPTFTIVDDPNVQPPISVPSVDMILNGYQEGSQISAATVETDAMVDVELLGFLEVIDDNKDGQPDNVSQATGAFKKDTVYAIVISLRAKNGYDISGLTAQSVSLDRSLLDMVEELEDYVAFNCIYLLDDIVRYTVTFETNGGSTISSIQVSKGKTLPPITDPTRAYYAFDGWYNDVALTQAFDLNTPITADTTLYAKWTPSPIKGMFLMTIDFNGGTSTMPSSGEVPVNTPIYFNPQIESVVTPPNGKVLAGFEIDGVPYSFGDEYLVTQNFTLKFLWKDAPVTTYTVTFDSDGGNAVTEQSVESGETAIKPADPTKEGYTFKGWYLGETEYDFTTPVAESITLKAKWEAVSLEPEHTCDIKPVEKVNPTCTEGGKEAYYKCEGCGKLFEDALGANEIEDIEAWGNLDKNGHTESDWNSDKDNHWKECTVADCGVIIENSKAAHKDDNNDGKCDICEYNIGITTTPGGNDKPSNIPQTGDNGMMWLWVALLLVSGFGVVATAAYSKKRYSEK